MALLSLCRVDELVKYSRSHLWIDPSGCLGDLNVAESPSVKWTWIEQGWRYDLQEIDDKQRVCSALNHMRNPHIQVQESALHEATDVPLPCLGIYQYLNALLKFLISELLMNTIRYDRDKQQEDIHACYKEEKQNWDSFLERLLDTCRVDANDTPAPMSLKYKNMKCIIIMYLQEARYRTPDAKKGRGEWGRALWTIEASARRLPSIDLQYVLPDAALQRALCDILPCCA